MADNVEITMSSSDKAVLSSLNSVDRALEKLADRMGKVEHASVSAARHSEQAFGGLTHQVTDAAKEVQGLILGFMSLEKVAELFLRTLEDIDKRRKKARDAQIEYADEIKAFAASVAGIMGGGEADRFARSIAARAHADPAKTAHALREASVAAGVHDRKGVQEIGQVVEQVLALHKNEPAADVGQMAAAAARFQVAAGPGAAPGAGVGLLELAKRESGLTSPEAMSRQLVPAILEGGRAGMGAGQSAALFATLAHAIGDPTGKLTKTAFTHLTEELGKHFPGKNPFKLIEQMEGGDKRLLDQFLHEQFVPGVGKVPGATFDDKSRAAVMSLLTGKDAAGRPTGDVAQFKRLTTEFNDPAAGQRFFDDIKKNFAQIPAVRLQERKEAGEAGAKQMQIGAERDAKIAEISEEIENNMAAAGFWWGRRMATGKEFDRRVALGEDPSKVGREIFEALARELENPPPMFKNVPFMGRSPKIYAADPGHAAIFRDLASQHAEQDEAEAATAEEERAERSRQGSGESSASHSPTAGVDWLRGPTDQKPASPSSRPGPGEPAGSLDAGVPRIPSNVRITRAEFNRMMAEFHVNAWTAWSQKAFQGQSSAYADVVEREANNEIARQQFLRERYDSQGGVIRVDPFTPGKRDDPMTGHQQQQVRSLREIVQRLDKLIAQGEKPVRVEAAGRRTEWASQSVPGISLGSR